MDRCLREFRIRGVKTNIPFLENVVCHPDFRAGRAVPMPLAPASKHVFVRDESRALVGVGEAHGALLAPRKVFV